MVLSTLYLWLLAAPPSIISGPKPFLKRDFCPLVNFLGRDKGSVHSLSPVIGRTCFYYYSAVIEPFLRRDICPYPVFPRTAKIKPSRCGIHMSYMTYIRRTTGIMSIGCLWHRNECMLPGTPDMMSRSKCKLWVVRHPTITASALGRDMMLLLAWTAWVMW